VASTPPAGFKAAAVGAPAVPDGGVGSARGVGGIDGGPGGRASVPELPGEGTRGIDTAGCASENERRSSFHPAMLGLRERQKVDRERRVVAAAARLFGSKGYAATTMQDVARRAGLAVGTVYNYFASKQELLLALARRDTEGQLAEGRRIVAAPPEDAVEAAAALIAVYERGLRRHGRPFWRELLATVIAQPTTVGAGVSRIDRQLIAQLTTLLERLRAKGTLAPDIDVHRAAVLLYGVYFSWFTFFVISDRMTMEHLRTEVRQATALVVRGLRSEHA